MSRPMNPTLYRRLQRRFGEVLVSKEGSTMSAHVVSGVDGKPRLQVTDRGEEYRVSCPYCHDTRKRLYIAHGHGTLVHGVRCLAIHCYNEDCFHDYLRV